MKPLLPFALAAAAILGSPLAIAEDESPASSLVAAAAESSATPSSPQETPPATTPPSPPAPPNQRPGGGRPGRDGQPGGDGNQFRHHERFEHQGGERPDGANKEGRGPRPQAPAPKPAPYIGIVTSGVPPILASQLGLAENFGLVVDNVLPNSPAATAGLQKYDVLKLYNDQQIVDPRQLVILVHATGKDGNATLTIIRKGQEQKVSIKVTEGVIPNLLGAHRPEPGQRGDGFDRRGLARDGREGFGHHGFGDGERRHEEFGRGHSDGGGFGHREFGHHRFAGRGFGEEGSDRDEHWGHHFSGREFDGHEREGRGDFDRHEFGHHHFEGRGFDRDREGDRDGDRQFGHREFEHEGPRHRPPGDGDRDRDFRGRPGGWDHHPSSDLEPAPESPAVDPEAPAFHDVSSAETAAVEMGYDPSFPAETLAAEEEAPAPVPLFEGGPLDSTPADTNVL